MASTLAEQVAVKQISENEFESVVNPDRMGNRAKISYGGCTLAVAVCAAFQTVQPNYHIYSASGNFLGPAFIDRKLRCTVRRIRDTRTFVTRLIEVSQVLDDGSKRSCLSMLADFQIQEKASLLTYSEPPRQKYSPPEKCLALPELRKHLVAKGVVTQAQADLQASLFALGGRMIESRPCPEGIFAQNLVGIAKAQPISQDRLPLTSRATGEWLRARHSLGDVDDNRDAHSAALAFIMDGALSFVPLSFNHMFLDDAGAVSTLDFALRWFSHKVDMTQWHCRELTTIAANLGRTYSEGRLWDSKGNMVAAMTQQCILRPKPPEQGKL